MQEKIEEEEELKREEREKERMASRSIVGTNYPMELIDMNFNIKKERKITTVIKSALEGLNTSKMGKSGSGTMNNSPEKKPSMLE